MKKSNKFSPEVRERAVRMVQEHRGDYPSLWAAIESIAPKIGCVPQTLNEWAKLDDTLKPEIQRVWQANMRVYGADKVYKQMRRERITQATLHRRAADETLGLARCQARQGGTHDH